jgi:hypothetical protein
MTITIELLKAALAKKGYQWYDDKPNLIGIRSTLDVPDSFNDFFCLVYQIPKMAKNLDLKAQQEFLNSYGFKGANGKVLAEDGVAGKNTTFALEQYNAVVGQEVIKIFPNTTNPGVYWLNHPMSKLGTGVLKPNQWVDCWSLGFHQGKSDHKALVQTGKVTVYRDNNKDNNYQLDESKTETGLFGINIHGSGKLKPSVIISKYSAGCQVFSNWNHKEFVMDICEKFKSKTKNKFTYTLLDEKDLNL